MLANGKFCRFLPCVQPLLTLGMLIELARDTFTVLSLCVLELYPSSLPPVPHLQHPDIVGPPKTSKSSHVQLTDTSCTVAMMMMVPGVFTGYIVVFAWISNTIPRPPSKRAAALAGVNAVSNAALIYTPYMYPSSAGPRYGEIIHSLNAPLHYPLLIFNYD
jgi:hypothetical protein